MKNVLRKTSVMIGGPLADTEYVLESSFSKKNEACIYYPKLPRACIPSGFIIVPSMNAAYSSSNSARGKFDIEVYCSEKFDMTLVPDKDSKVMAGTWTETLSGGSHLHPTWKKNPRYTLKLKHTSKKELGDSPHEKFYSVRIALCRHGTSWRSKVYTVVHMFRICSKLSQILYIRNEKILLVV
jgi:hypothetical protein